MTEEEKKAIECLKIVVDDINECDVEYYIDKDMLNDIQTLLNLIEKLKNKVIKRDNDIIYLEETAEKELLTKIEVKENYISKGKIREKIETLKKEATDRLNEGRENIFVTKRLIIDILEELLKEE